MRTCTHIENTCIVKTKTRKRKESGRANGLSLLVTCHTPTPTPSVTHPALVGPTLFSSLCLTIPAPQILTIPLSGTYSSNYSGNSYSCIKTQLEKPLPAVKLHQYLRTPPQAVSNHRALSNTDPEAAKWSQDLPSLARLL